MISIYKELIASLKNECKKKRVKYENIIKTLNRYEYDEIIHMIEIINDESICDIIEDIIEERIVIANNIADMYNSLPLMNHYLEIFNKEPQPSLTKARKLFKKKIFINIYDFHYQRYNKETKKIYIKNKFTAKSGKKVPFKISKGKRVPMFFD
jgi:hypothetical protein